MERLADATPGNSELARTSDKNALETLKRLAIFEVAGRFAGLYEQVVVAAQLRKKF